jgi:hypothetical protein
VRGFCARRKRHETASGNSPLQPIAVEARPLIVTLNCTHCGIVNRGRNVELRRQISAHQKSAYGSKPQRSMKPPRSKFSITAVAIHPHMHHFCE